MSRIKVCQGERDTDVTHVFDTNERVDENYSSGVNIEQCPLFDFSKEPWRLVQSMTRQMILSYQVIRALDLESTPGQYTVVDVGCGYGEAYVFLSRARKAKGVQLKYIGIDVDKDKKIIAQQLRPNIDYRVHDILTDYIPDECPVDCVLSGDVLEHFDAIEATIYLRKLSMMVALNGYLILSFATPMSQLHIHNPFHKLVWTLQDVDNATSKLGFELLDGFYLGLPVRDWKFRSPRIPNDLARNVISVFSEQMGNEGIVILQKVRTNEQ